MPMKPKCRSNRTRVSHPYLGVQGTWEGKQSHEDTIESSTDSSKLNSVSEQDAAGSSSSVEVNSQPGKKKKAEGEKTPSESSSHSAEGSSEEPPNTAFSPRAAHKLPQQKRSRREKSETATGPAGASSSPSMVQESQPTTASGEHSHKRKRASFKRFEWTDSLEQLLMALVGGGENWTAISRGLGCTRLQAMAHWKSCMMDEEEADLCRSSTDPSDEDRNSAASGASSGGSGKRPKKTERKKTSSLTDEQARELIVALYDSDNDLYSVSGSEKSCERCENAETEEQQQQQTRFMAERIWPELYRTSSSAQAPADDSFSRYDSAILAAANTKHKAEMWLHIRATFFNATRHWIPLEVIKNRYERHEQQDELRRQTSETEESQNVREWVDRVAGNEVLNPNM